MQRITLIGVGKMGKAIAHRLLSMGFSLTAYNRTPGKMHDLITHGVKEAPTLKEAVESADIIISCLLDDHAVMQLCIGNSGIIQFMQTNAVHIGTATILPKTAESLYIAHRNANKHYVSAAVLGVPKVARAGQLTTFYAGTPNNIKKTKRIINAFSTQLIDLGTNPKAPLTMKVAMNYSLITALELISELYVFAEKSGLDLDVIQKALHQIYAHPGFKHYIDKIKNRSFEVVNFDLKGGIKDVSVFQEAFTDVGAVPRLGHVLKERFISAKSNHLAEKDWSAIYEIIRQEAGLL